MSGSARALPAKNIKQTAKSFFMGNLKIDQGTPLTRKLLITGEKSCGIIYEIPLPKKAIARHV
jgi:hypothetical protein